MARNNHTHARLFPHNPTGCFLTSTTKPTWQAPPRHPQTGLPRKEVIQPHLPVRLPCYDFVPIASPTFDSSLPKQGLGHRLRVLPTFMT
jgi:hypothetical protein